MKAGYNYQFSRQDLGTYAHGAKYVIELLYDSTEDLSPELAATLRREDVRHFDGAAVPWHHFDKDGVVPADRSKCHSPAGVPFLVQHGVAISEPPSDGLECTTCHDKPAPDQLGLVTSHYLQAGAILPGSEAAGNTDVAVCTDCRTAHYVQPPDGPVNRIARTCQRWSVREPHVACVASVEPCEQLENAPRAGQ